MGFSLLNDPLLDLRWFIYFMVMYWYYIESSLLNVHIDSIHEESVLTLYMLNSLRVIIQMINHLNPLRMVLIVNESLESIKNA